MVSITHLPPGGLQIGDLVFRSHIDISGGDSHKVGSHSTIRLLVQYIVVLFVCGQGVNLHSIKRDGSLNKMTCEKQDNLCIYRGEGAHKVTTSV